LPLHRHRCQFLGSLRPYGLAAVAERHDEPASRNGEVAIGVAQPLDRPAMLLSVFRVAKNYLVMLDAKQLAFE
jgi:hypothetical protein